MKIHINSVDFHSYLLNLLKISCIIRKKKEMLMNDFRSKNFNYLVFKRGDENHFSFLFRKVLRIVLYT